MNIAYAILLASCLGMLAGCADHEMSTGEPMSITWVTNSAQAVAWEDALGRRELTEPETVDELLGLLASVKCRPVANLRKRLFLGSLYFVMTDGKHRIDVYEGGPIDLDGQMCIPESNIVQRIILLTTLNVAEEGPDISN